MREMQFRGPVYDVFQSEDMSSRGWYEIVTAQDYSYLESKRVVDACLNCKSCRTICPADVDVSDLILKRRAEHPNWMAGLIFRLHAHQSLFEPLLKLLARTQRIWDRPTVVDGSKADAASTSQDRRNSASTQGHAASSFGESTPT